jgi:hypothetical protein
MARSLSFSFSLSTLTHEGDAICDAAEAHAADLGARVKSVYVTETRALIEKVSGGDAAQKGGVGSVGTLTKEQNAKWQVVQDKVAAAKKTAKRAFAGDKVKLREAFQVGVDKPGDLASSLQRARIVLASCLEPENAAALEAKGWLASDTTALADAIEALDAADDTQEMAKGAKKGVTGDRNQQANELYEHLLTIQNAANLQWPSRDGQNLAVRAEFRLGIFPPKAKGKNGKGQEQPSTPAVPPTA